MASSEVLQLIAKEKKEETGSLNLWNKELTELPKELLELTHLQTLGKTLRS